MMRPTKNRIVALMIQCILVLINDVIKNIRNWMPNYVRRFILQEINYKITNCGRWKNISGICAKMRFNSKGLSGC